MAVVLSLVRQWACRGSIYYDSDIRFGWSRCHRLPIASAIARPELRCLRFCIGVDFVGHLDTAEAIAHVVVYAENALESISPSKVAVTERS
jgi:hypothetical protein